MAPRIEQTVHDTRMYACETRVVAGLGSINLIPSELERCGIQRPALVVDQGIAEAGLIEQWLPTEVACIEPRIICPMNPNLQQVQAGVDTARPKGCDGVLIVGGGSAICMGKAIAICLVNHGDLLDYEGSEKIDKRPVPTICVPTTAGSGSEVSRVLVLHEHGRRQELIIRAMGSEPRVALLDGRVLVSAPRKVLLDAALDAISHACESLWSRNRSLITDGLAEKALETFLTRLPAALNHRELDALQDIMEASSAANLACGNTGLALCHAMNASPDVALPHGYVNGCLLTAVASFNRPFMDERHQSMVDRLPSLFAEIGWQAKFAKGEVDRDTTELFVNASRDHPFRNNNIRSSSDDDCYSLLRQSGALLD